MSRLRALYLPFVQGQNDAIAREVLPDGAVATLTNGRFNRLGELVLRRGWRPVTMLDTDGNTVVARDVYSMSDSLVALSKSSSTALPTLSAYVNPATSRPWVTTPGHLTPVVDVRERGGLPRSGVFTLRASAALTSDSVYGAVVTVSAGPIAQLRVFRVATDETVLYAALSPADATYKILSFGATFGLLRATGAAVTLSLIDPAAAQPVVGTPLTLISTAATVFDAVAAIPATVGGTPSGFWVATVLAGAVTASKFTLAGVQIGSGKSCGTSKEAVALATDDTTAHVHAVTQDSAAHTLDLLTFDSTSPYATTAGPTTVVASAVSPGWFAVGISDDARATTAGVDAATTTSTFVSTRSASHAVSSFATRGETLLVGGFIHLPGGTGSSVSAFSAARDGAWVLLDAAPASQPWFALHGLGVLGSPFGASGGSPPFAPAQAPDGTCLVLGCDSANQVEVRALTLSNAVRRQGLTANGELYITGGVLAKWSGVLPAETSFLAPVLQTLTPSNGAGALTVASVYHYRAIIEWVDAQGRTHQGEVSAEASVTTGASDDTVAVLVQLPPASARQSNLAIGPSLKLFRTEAAPGELFYLTATVDDISRTVDAVTVTDLTSDAVLINHERLYTEGDTGTTSGRLDNVLPRPSRYIGATRDRLVLAARTPEYQFSQLTLPSEPINFADTGVSGPVALVYFDRVTEDITAVGTLDDTVVVGTARGLYITSGDGPNFAGVGEFASPAKLPTNLGFYDWRSLVEAADGLWFLGDVDKLYHLGRGQPSPEWAGKAVQDRLAGGVVGAAVDQSDQVVAWAVAGASPTLVVRGLTPETWSIETLPFTPTSLVQHLGALWAVASDGVVWSLSPTAYGDGASGASAVALTVETGDVQVFGPLDGWGRLAALAVEGVFETAAAVKMDVSYDQGLTFTALGTHTVTGLTVGEVFQRQFYPARQRGGKFRLRLTMTPTATTGEGCRLTGVTVYHTTRTGPTRLASSKRL